MRWDAAVAAWLAPIKADSVVVGVLGTDPEFHLAGETDFFVPSLEYSLITTAEPFMEVYWRTLIQLDFWTETLPVLVTLEKALVRLLHLETPATIGGIPMWSRMQLGGGPLQGSQDGRYGSSLDFQLTYLRARYST